MILSEQRGRRMEKIQVKNFVIGMVGTNCYVVSHSVTKEAFVVDMAGASERLLEYIAEEGLKMKALLLTHGHFDHIMGIDWFLKHFSVPVYAHEKEKELLENADFNASIAYGSAYTYTKAQYVKDGEELNVAGIHLRVLYTPGHTAGGCCYYLPEEKVLFSGDTLFYESVGRTDLPTGSAGELIRSVKEKLLGLPEDTVVFPGHMRDTTIGHEKQYNPFLG